MNNALWWVAQNALCVAVLLPIVWLAARLLRARPAEQHLLWFLLLVKLVTPPVVVWPWSWEWDQGTKGGGEEGTSIVAPVSVGRCDVHASPAAKPLEWELSRQAAFVSPSPASPDLPLPHSDPPPSSVESSAFASKGTAQRIGWREALVAVWLVGAVITAIGMLRHVARQRSVLKGSHEASERLRRCVELASQRLNLRPVECRVSDRVTSPFVSCVWRRTLVWPASLCDEAALAACEAVLAHELCHVRRRDHWVARLEAAAAVVWWWNPVFWYVRCRLEETRELACDALALELTATERRSFAELLLSFSAGTQPVTFAPLRIAPRHPMRRRLAMVFDTKVTGRVSRKGLLLAALLGVAVLPGWAWTQEEPSGANEPAEASAVEAEPANAEPVAPTESQPATESDSPVPAELPAAAPPARNIIPPTTMADLGDGKILRLRFNPDDGSVTAEVLDGERLVQSLTTTPGTSANVPNSTATQLLVFTSSSADPMNMMRHRLDKLAVERNLIRVIDIDGERTIAQRYGVTSVPTFITFKDGKEYERAVGFRSEKELKQMWDRAQRQVWTPIPQLPSPQPAPAAPQPSRVLSPQLRLLENAMKLAELDVEEKKLLLEDSRRANSQNPGNVPAQKMRSLEFELRRAELKADSARIEFESARRTEEQMQETIERAKSRRK